MENRASVQAVSHERDPSKLRIIFGFHPDRERIVWA